MRGMRHRRSAWWAEQIRGGLIVTLGEGKSRFIRPCRGSGAEISPIASAVALTVELGADRPFVYREKVMMEASTVPHRGN